MVVGWVFELKVRFGFSCIMVVLLVCVVLGRLWF